jgi:hypothetical protein
MITVHMVTVLDSTAARHRLANLKKNATTCLAGKLVQICSHAMHHARATFSAHSRGMMAVTLETVLGIIAALSRKPDLALDPCTRTDTTLLVGLLVQICCPVMHLAWVTFCVHK